MIFLNFFTLYGITVFDLILTNYEINVKIQHNFKIEEINVNLNSCLIYSYNNFFFNYLFDVEIFLKNQIIQTFRLFFEILNNFKKFLEKIQIYIY